MNNNKDGWTPALKGSRVMKRMHLNGDGTERCLEFKMPINNIDGSQGDYVFTINPDSKMITKGEKK